MINLLINRELIERDRAHGSYNYYYEKHVIQDIGPTHVRSAAYYSFPGKSPIKSPSSQLPHRM